MKHCEVNHTELLVPDTHVLLIADFQSLQYLKDTRD